MITTFVTIGSAYNHPNEVFVGNIGEKVLKRITHHNPELEQIPFQNYEHIEYEARDGLLITGLLLKPVNYRDGTRYPLICQIHGGPEAAYTHGWNTSYAAMTQLYSQHGFMVFLPNYRASTGRGVEFAKANHRDGGGKEFTDVIDGIEYLYRQGLIDRDRVGIVGGSYGGYFANLAATRYAGNFAAAVSWAGISNQFSKTGRTDTPLENILVHFDRAHYQDEHRIGIMEASPIWYLEQAVREENETPLLIFHGETDARVPYGQAVELYRGLLLSYKHHRGMTRGEIPVTLISYPRAGHGTNEVRQQLHFSNTVLEFFQKHLMIDN
jgi:dipeptidyl aminopeptidase/acylaminoacyl peptidase